MKKDFENMKCGVVLLQDHEIHPGCTKKAGTVLDVTTVARDQWVRDGIAATPEMVGRMDAGAYVMKMRHKKKTK
jgi:hypothetical protein